MENPGMTFTQNLYRADPAALGPSLRSLFDSRREKEGFTLLSLFHQLPSCTPSQSHNGARYTEINISTRSPFLLTMGLHLSTITMRRKEKKKP